MRKPKKSYISFLSRALSLVLTLSLLVSVLPSTAFAVNGDFGNFPSLEEWKTSVGKDIAASQTPIIPASEPNASLSIGSLSVITPKYGSNGKFIAPIGAVEDGSIAIASRAELELIGKHIDYPLDGKFHLTNDIDLSGAEWVPIGEFGYDFVGTFDGQGFVISNLTLTGTDNYYSAGLFGAIRDATIKNVGLEATNIDFSLSSSSISYAAGIVGHVHGNSNSNKNTIIDNCYNTGTITSSASAISIGGILGHGYSDVYGSNSDITVSNCYNSASVVSTYTRAGGIVGSVDCSAGTVTIKNCFNAGSVSAITSLVSHSQAGGILGYSLDFDDGFISISNCHNVGNVESYAYTESYSGGILGNGNGEISLCYNTGSISASYSGGILGNGNGKISLCYNTGSISASSSAGGIMAGSGSTASNCYNVGEISASSIAGGIMVNGSASNCYNTGNISASIVGGITGTGGISTFIINCYWNSDSAQIVNGVERTIGEKRGNGNLPDLTTRLTSAEMRLPGSFIGFDFTNIWSFEYGVNDGYPILAEPQIIPVSSITDVPTETAVGLPLSLAGTINPSDAENKSIIWTIVDSGSTGAILAGSNVLVATAEGTVIVRATILNGIARDIDYQQDFTITINTIVPVTSISGIPGIITAGVPETLIGIVNPPNAANQVINWSVISSGTTGATITNGNILNTTSAGTTIIRATVPNGVAYGTDLQQDFTIEVITKQVVYIADAAQLAAIGGQENANKYYILEDKITILDNWKPIEDFRGTLDGAGHTIELKSYVLDHYGTAGLFGTIHSGSVTIKNLAVETGGGRIYAQAPGSSYSHAYAGGFVGKIIGGQVRIENCYFDGNVEAEAYYNSLNLDLEWLVQEGIYSIIDFFVPGMSDIGAILTALSDIFTKKGSYAYAGGLVGYIDVNAGVTIVNSYVRGKVYSDAGYFGDLSTFLGTVSDRAYAGGLVGYKGSGSLSVGNCYAVNSVEAHVLRVLIDFRPAGSYVGGLIGRGSFDTIAGTNYRLSTQSIIGNNKDNTNVGVTNTITVDAMRNSSSFSGWNFINTWGIDNSGSANRVNSGYPYLRVFYDDPIVNVKSITNADFTNGFISELNSGKNLEYMIDKELSLFPEVFVNNSLLVLNQDYTINSGSVIVTLLPSFLDTLTEGINTLTVCFSDGDIIEDQFLILERTDEKINFDLSQIVSVKIDGHLLVSEKHYDPVTFIIHESYLEELSEGTHTLTVTFSDSSEIEEEFYISKKEIMPSSNQFLAQIVPVDELPDFDEYIAISNRAGLEAMKDNLSGKYYLTNNIDLESVEWTPIGDNSTNSDTSRFTGIFDGQGFVIKNMSITGDREYSGLFGYVRNATIRNIGLESASTEIYLDSGSMVYSGGTCGVVSGSSIIDNCYNTGDLSASASPTIDHSTNIHIGGICGASDFNNSSSAIIRNCYNTGNVTASSAGAFAGGICGSLSWAFYSGTPTSIIKNCYNTGNVFTSCTDSIAYAGGICANSTGDSDASDCYNTGDVFASSTDSIAYAGGIWGYFYGGGNSIILNDCYNIGSVYATSLYLAYAGGICGASRDGSDQSDSAFIVSNCFNTGAVFASITSTVISNAHVAYAGGICGEATKYFNNDNSIIIINNCYNTGDVTSTYSYGISYVGSICGYSWSELNPTIIEDCYWKLESAQIVNGFPRQDEWKLGVGQGTDTTIPLTSETMRKQASYIGFDFENVWGYKRAEYDYPVLRAFGEVDVSSTAILLGTTGYIKGQVEVLSMPLKVPVSIIDNPGLTSFQFIVRYDPSILTAVSVENGNVWSGSITKNLNESGTVILLASSAFAVTGDGNIAIIEFEVNHAAANGIYPITIEIEEIKTTNAQTDQLDVLHTKTDSTVSISSVMRGDVYEDNVVRASDATEVLFFLAELKDLTARQMIAAKLMSPLYERVNIFDANEILLIAAQLKQAPQAFSMQMPQMAASGFSTLSEESVDLSIGTEIGERGETVIIPISISNNSGFSAFDFKIDYDKTRLTPISVVKGSVWSGDMVFNLEAGEGEYILINGISDANAGANGKIVEMSFRVNTVAPQGTADISLTVNKIGYIDTTYSIIDLPFAANNGYVAINAESAGVSITGEVRSYNPKVATTITIYDTVTKDYVASTTIPVEALTGQVTQGFTLEGIPVGVYDLVITKDGHLSYTITGIVFDGEVIDLTSDTTKPYSLITLAAGDINGDGRINVNDVTYLLVEYNKAPTVWPFADIDGNGTVNVQDITYLLVNYNRLNVVVEY